MTLKTAIASILLATACITATNAQAAIRHDLDIPAQELGSALVVLARQARIQVVYSADLVQGHSTRRLSGSMTPDEALDKLLAKTGLKYEFIDEQTVTLSPSGNAGESSLLREGDSPGTHGSPEPGARRLAQEDTAPRGEEARQTSLRENAKDRLELEEIVVTGSHVRGAEPAGSKVLRITREEIERSGYARIPDLLATLPQNFKGAGEEANQSNGNTTSGAEFQLRGLGPGTTLTLVNGLRQASGGLTGAYVDISSIPSSAVERIEILSEGASALYGSDAIGGVINIILREDFQGAETRVRLGTASGEADELQLSQVMGTRWRAGNVLLGYQYSKRGEVPALSRETTALNGDMTRNGGTDFRQQQFRFESNPATILCPFDSLDCFPGDPAFAVPSGQNGRNLTPADLIPGGVNYTDQASATDILPEQTMHSAFATASFALSESWKLSASGRFNVRETQRNGGARNTTLEVPASNAFYVDAFGDGLPLSVAFDFAKDLGPVRNDSKTETYDTGLSLTGGLAADWQISVTGFYAREKSRADADTFDAFNPQTADVLATALASSDPAIALNVFGDGAFNSPDLLAQLHTISVNTGISDLWSVGAIADGPVFKLPGGDARVAVGIDYRDESQDIILSDYLGTNRTPNERQVSAAFTEFSLPLVGAENARPGVQRLSLSLAARYENYSDFGDTVDPKIGITYQPVSALALRGTWGTSFRAPPFYLSSTGFGPVTALPFFFPDENQPQLPNGTSRVLAVLGNNENLTKETATVWTAGFDILPPGGDFEFSATYFDIAYRDKIQAIGTLNLGEDERFFSDVIIRNPTQAQLDAFCNNPEVTVFGDCGGPIPVAVIFDGRVRNVANLDVQGLDFDVQYGMRSGIGAWRFGLGGTYTFSYEQAVTSTSPQTDVVDSVGNPLDLRLRGSLNWSLGSWSAGTTVNYAGSYDDRFSSSIEPHSVDSLTTIDVQVGYQVEGGAAWLDGFRLLLNAVNVFDEEPPFVDMPNGYDGHNATILGRLVSVQLIKTF